jgi:hypothetical protein
VPRGDARQQPRQHRELADKQCLQHAPFGCDQDRSERRIKIARLAPDFLQLGMAWWKQ